MNTASEQKKRTESNVNNVKKICNWCTATGYCLSGVFSVSILVFSNLSHFPSISVHFWWMNWPCQFGVWTCGNYSLQWTGVPVNSCFALSFPGTGFESTASQIRINAHIFKCNSRSFLKLLLLVGYKKCLLAFSHPFNMNVKFLFISNMLVKSTRYFIGKKS